MISVSNCDGLERVGPSLYSRGLQGGVLFCNNDHCSVSDCDGLERIGPCIVGSKEEFYPGGVEEGSEHTLYRYIHTVTL